MTADPVYPPIGGGARKRLLMEMVIRSIQGVGRTMAVYAGLLWFGAAVVAVALVDADFGIESPAILVALAVLGALGERASVRLSSTVEVSVSSLPMLFAAVVMGPVDAMIVSAV